MYVTHKVTNPSKESFIEEEDRNALFVFNDMSELLVISEVFEIWDKGYKVKKINLLFFLKTSLVYLGTSPDTIGKIS